MDGDGTWCTNSEDCYGIMGMARVLGDLGDLGILQNRKPTLSGMVYYELGKGLDSSSHLQSA
jgi:hypothetical protein